MENRQENGRVVVNIGCGATPTEGAVNLDNSFSVWLGKHPRLCGLLRRLHIISADQARYAAFCGAHGIRRANCMRLPFSDGGVDVLYTSHMLEHLPKTAVQAFLKEAGRALKPEGILRIALPDTEKIVARYLIDHDCDKLVEALLLAPEDGGSFSGKLRMCLFGHRGHHWMYDAASFTKVLQQNGFSDVRRLEPGETTIPFATGMNLRERAEESFYLECRKGQEISGAAADNVGRLH